MIATTEHPGVLRIDLVVLGLGSNLAGPWGRPEEALRRAVRSMEAIGLTNVARSSIYGTTPCGTVRQPMFANAVVVARAGLPPAMLLRRLKAIERAAGRRRGVHWGPRTLDLDLLAHGSRTIDARAHATRIRPLVLPHPELHRRGFVLVPLVEVLPLWRHPTLGLSAADLLRRQPRLARGVSRIGEL